MHETQRLAQFVAATGYLDLPQPVVEAIKVYVLDNLASCCAGSPTPWANMVGSVALESASSGPCSVFARDWTTTPSYAALVNGTMIGGFECDHAFVPGSCHPSAAVFPAVLAIAEREHLDGASFLAALALGYEVCCRVGRAATRAVEDVRGFHGPGTNAPFGSAVGVGKALGLEVGLLVNALGIAGSHGAGLLEFAREGAMTKRLHVARGAQMGLESALLAAKGFTGPSTVLEGERGFLHVYSPAPQPDLLLEGLGDTYLLREVTLKAYACHVSFHAVIDGIARFRRTHAYDPARLQHVKVVGAPRMMEARHCVREPGSVLGAQYSLPFSAAIALSRNIEEPWAFSEETLRDSQVRRLARNIELVEDRDRFGRPGGPVAEVTLTLAGSEEGFEVTNWKGAPSNPYTYPEIAEKFRCYATPALLPGRCDEIIARVERLEKEPDMADLARLLRSG
ncbi:MAG: MmgE/PrpD family protein [Chloroflexi bacterium]|nr:MmgE/PrpD family protein [Chloroflexota bacterium]